MTVAEKTGDGDGYVAWLEKRSRTGSRGNHGDGWHREEAEAQEAGQQRRGPSLQRAEDDAGRRRAASGPRPDLDPYRGNNERAGGGSEWGTWARVRLGCEGIREAGWASQVGLVA